jgi:hypothetical protein
MQTRTHSMLESLTNTVIGYVVAICSQLIVFPLFDIHIPLQDNLLIGLWFTAISLTRAYLVRRWFVRRTEVARLPWRCVTGLGVECCCQRRTSP